MKATILSRLKHPLLTLILGIAGVVCLLLFLILARISTGISAPLQHQRAAERWQGAGELRYEQVSVFRPVAESLKAETIENANRTIDTKLEEAGIPDAKYLIAYGAHSTVQATSERGRSAADLTLVGGDFFLLHNYQFLSGAGFERDDVMQDRVVLDELAAWQLFSSNECVGLSVNLGGRTFFVAGVVGRETDRPTETCYGESPRIYASYQGWYNTPGEKEKTAAPVTFCEAVLPEPVDDFAITALAEGIGAEKDEVCDNTKRYTLEGLWENFKSLHMQGIVSNAVVYPYWESAARLAANERSVLLIPQILLLLLPLGWAVYGVILLWKLVKAGGRGVVHVADNILERRKTRKYVRDMARRRQMTERNDRNENNQMETDAVLVAGNAPAGDSTDGMQ